MATLTMTLAQLSLTGAKNLNPASVDVMRKSTIDQFTGQLPVRAVLGVSNTYRRRGSETILNVNKRAVGTASAITEGYATANVVTDNCGRVIAQASMDTLIEKAHDLTNPWREQVDAYIPVLQDKIANEVINGTGTDGGFKGFKGLCNAIGSSQQYTPNTTTSGAEVKFVYLDKLALRVRGARKAYIMNPNIALDLKQLGVALGGNIWSQIMVPYGVPGPGGVIQIQDRPVQAFNGIPIYETEWMTTETTCGKSGKYRIFCVSMDDTTGVELFYPSSVPAIGMEVHPLQMKEGFPEKFMRFEWTAGLSTRHAQCIAQCFNIKLTNT
jgi:hypothetical protein